MTVAPSDRIGIIVVHGLGEQKRFDFLDEYTRELIRALQDRGHQVSVDLGSASAAAFQAAQDTWSGGPKPSVTLQVTKAGATNPGDVEVSIGVHEVWWADVNEPYSLRKQFRFWLWGLGVWNYPKRPSSTLGTAVRVAPPVVTRVGRARLHLYMVGSFFVLSALSVGSAIAIFCRLFGIERPKLLQLVANYISCVKLYNQKRRYDKSLLGNDHEFLDNVNEPPRVSIRRRMIRAIADVACQDYDRWYVLAHSQGTIVALNGLMETGYSWPGYLDPDRLKALRKKGMSGPSCGPPASTAGIVMPARPAWAATNEIAYRRRIFSSFRGLLTFGSPLEKFATIWPALVPISREPGFEPDAAWINVFDPVDPVSGVLTAFTKAPPHCCPGLRNVGYKAGDVLLANHLKYFLPRGSGRNRDDLASAVADWLLTDNPYSIPPKSPSASLWFKPDDPTFSRRRRFAVVSWAVAAGVSATIGAFLVPLVVNAAAAAFNTTVWRFDERWSSAMPPVPRIPVWIGSALLVVGSPAIVGFWNRIHGYRKEALHAGGAPPPSPWTVTPEDPWP